MTVGSFLVSLFGALLPVHASALSVAIIGAHHHIGTLAATYSESKGCNVTCVYPANRHVIITRKNTFDHVIVNRMVVSDVGLDLLAEFYPSAQFHHIFDPNSVVDVIDSMLEEVVEL